MSSFIRSGLLDIKRYLKIFTVGLPFAMIWALVPTYHLLGSWSESKLLMIIWMGIGLGVAVRIRGLSL